MSEQIYHKQLLVRVAARSLARAGLVHAYGHCSSRLDAKRFVVCAARPMGLIASAEEGTVVAVDEPLPEHVLGEVRIHQQIYMRRPEVGGVCRIMPPSVMALSAMGETPRPRHGFGSYFYPRPPFWDDPQLLRSDPQASALAQLLGDQPAIVMRGNGAVTAAETLEDAVVLAWYLEDAARVELTVRAANGADSDVLSAEDCRQRATRSGRIFERMWDYLSHGDPELPELARWYSRKSQS